MWYIDINLSREAARSELSKAVGPVTEHTNVKERNVKMMEEEPADCHSLSDMCCADDQ